jgi:ABC-2 type transport system ATP-binding protein
VTTESVEPGLLEIEGITAEQIGVTAAANDIVLCELAPRQASLEEAFMVLTRDEVEFHANPSTSDDLEGALAA